MGDPHAIAVLGDDVCRYRWKNRHGGRHMCRRELEHDGPHRCTFCTAATLARPDDLRDNPYAMWGPDGEYLGLAGGTVKSASDLRLHGWERPKGAPSDASDLGGSGS